jgi:hypothetical protein
VGAKVWLYWRSVFVPKQQSDCVSDTLLYFLQIEEGERSSEPLVSKICIPRSVDADWDVCLQSKTSLTDAGVPLIELRNGEVVE